MILGNEQLDFLSPQVDFEGSLAENHFTVLPNIDPDIDESECWVCSWACEPSDWGPSSVGGHYNWG